MEDRDADANPARLQVLSQDEEPILDLDDIVEVIDRPYSIKSFGMDYRVDSLVGRIQSSEILVPTFSGSAPKSAQAVSLQADYLWPRTKADRFIESLLLGLPVPGIFLVKEPSGPMLLLDGHQRLHTLYAYYCGGLNDDVYRLSACVQKRFVGKRYVDLGPEDRRRLDSSTIHTTVISQEGAAEDLSGIYTIFERLNTGGMYLQPQEVRFALYHGRFVALLQKLNENEAWRKLMGPRSMRLKDMEMILRFFAFHYFSRNYMPPMKTFLNRYMAANRYLQAQSDVELTRLFKLTTQCILAGIGAGAFRPKGVVNAAVVDSIMIGVAKRLASQGQPRDLQSLKTPYDSLFADQEFLDATETGTSQPANIRTRLTKATMAFSQIQ